MDSRLETSWKWGPSMAIVGTNMGCTAPGAESGQGGFFLADWAAGTLEAGLWTCDLSRRQRTGTGQWMTPRSVPKSSCALRDLVLR